MARSAATRPLRSGHDVPVPGNEVDPDSTSVVQADAPGRLLEAQSIHIMREVAAEFERPALMFSGGKDSIVMLHLARKAFFPSRPPFPVLHIDTGRNFPEVLEFRDRTVEGLGIRLVVGHVQDDIDSGRISDEPWASRNPKQAADTHAVAHDPRERIGRPLRRCSS